MSLIYFTRAVRKTHPQDDPRPLLVHCSAGVGRTGTFIVLDTMLDRMEQDGMIHIYDCVTHIRKQRVLLVQTLVRLTLYICEFMYCEYMTLYMYAVKLLIYSACMHVYNYAYNYAYTIAMCGITIICTHAT